MVLRYSHVQNCMWYQKRKKERKKERKFVTKEKVPFEIQNVLLSQKNAQLKRVDDVEEKKKPRECGSTTNNQGFRV